MPKKAKVKSADKIDSPETRPGYVPGVNFQTPRRDELCVSFDTRKHPQHDGSYDFKKPE